MRDYYLKAKTKTALLEALKEAGYVSDEGDIITDSVQHAILYIGRIMIEPATFDQDNNQLTPIRWHSGFHANLRLQEGELHPALSGLVIYPETPCNVWF